MVPVDPRDFSTVKLCDSDEQKTTIVYVSLRSVGTFPCMVEEKVSALKCATCNQMVSFITRRPCLKYHQENPGPGVTS